MLGMPKKYYYWAILLWPPEHISSTRFRSSSTSLLGFQVLGPSRTVFTAHVIDEMDSGKLNISELDAKWLSATMCEFILRWLLAPATLSFSIDIAGVDTTLSTLQVFYLAMTLYPDAQRKAQEEIDRVIGTDRLPGCEE